MVGPIWVLILAFVYERVVMVVWVDKGTKVCSNYDIGARIETEKEDETPCTIKVRPRKR